MRLIDADALIKVVTDGIAPSTKDGGFEHPFDILRAIDNAPTIEVNQWVSVKDRPPEDGCRKLVTYESKEVGMAYFARKVIIGDEITHNVWVIPPEDEDEGEVVAWQRLPEPYKGEQKGE